MRSSLEKTPRKKKREGQTSIDSLKSNRKKNERKKKKFSPRKGVYKKQGEHKYTVIKMYRETTGEKKCKSKWEKRKKKERKKSSPVKARRKKKGASISKQLKKVLKNSRCKKKKR